MKQKSFFEEILLPIIATLANRPKDKRIDIFLDSLFKKYNDTLLQIDDRYLETISFSQLYDTIEKVEQRILQSLKDYFNGRLDGAILEIDYLFQNIDLVDGFNTTILNKDDIWYRSRLKEDGTRLYERKEMFHIPEYLREKVNSQRFSFNGYPCLYLGKSIWACWEGLDEPHLDDICFSAFKLTEDLKLLDLSIPSEDLLKTKSFKDYYKILITLPLAMACSVKTLNEKANFKAEYVIPQLMMVNLLNLWNFEGFIYSSTKKNPALNWKEEYLLNIVLPVSGDFDENGLCKVLKDMFTVTSPINYKYEFLKSNVSNMITASEQEVQAIVDNVLYDKIQYNKDEDMYPRALFGQMESILQKMEFSKI